MRQEKNASAEQPDERKVCGTQMNSWRLKRVPEIVKSCKLYICFSADYRYFNKEKTDVTSVITGSIARSATRQYLSYSQADFEVFRPTGATRCTNGGEIWPGEGPLLHAKFHPDWCNDKGIGPPNCNFYWNLIKIWNINAPQGRIPCAIFTHFAELVTSFMMC